MQFDSNLFKTYYVSGKYPEEVNANFAEQLGKAVGTIYKKVIVGMDNRESSPILQQAFIKGIISVGADVINSGCGPADMHLSQGKYYPDVDLIAMITASHLGKDMNGFRLAHNKGDGFTSEDWNEIKQILASDRFAKPPNSGKIQNKYDEIKQHYFSEIMSHFEKFFPNVKINARILVDSAGGAALTAGILKSLGADVVEASVNRDAEPTKQSLSVLKPFFEKDKFDLAIAHDIDADRFAALDKNGAWIEPEKLAFLFMNILFKDKGLMVLGVDAPQTLVDAAKAKGLNVNVTCVGDVVIANEMMNKNGTFAMEPSGHFFYAPLSMHSSGCFFAMLLSAIAKDLAEKLDSVPNFHVARKKFKVAEVREHECMNKIMNSIVAIIKKKYDIITDIDGIKFKACNSYVLVRSSATEPILRVSVEGDSVEKCNEVMDKIVLELNL